MKTKYGDFGTYRDMYLFMKDENLKEIEFEASYCLTKISICNWTIEDVKKAMEQN